MDYADAIVWFWIGLAVGSLGLLFWAIGERQWDS